MIGGWHLKYRPCVGCGEHCWRADEATEAAPCWGVVLFEVHADYAVPARHSCGAHGTPNTYKPLGTPNTYKPLRMAPIHQRPLPWRR
jgi:hypothetical protein